MPTQYLHQLHVGQSASLTKTIEEQDITRFAEVTGDNNPVHLNETFAKGTIFKTRIAHGMLTASLFSGLLGMQLPGNGTIYLRQNLRFRAPVKLGDTVVATVSVREINLERKRVVLDTIAKVGDTVVVDGEAEVIPPVAV
jgi:3-hydroxybutyryl-CoA dehydratase